MTVINQSQIRDLTSTAAGMASVSTGDGRKLVYVRDLNAWFSPTVNGAVADGKTILNGPGGTKWAIVSPPSFPGSDWTTGKAYKPGDTVIWNGFLLYCLTAHTAPADLITTWNNWQYVNRTAAGPTEGFFTNWGAGAGAPGAVISIAGSLHYVRGAFSASSAQSLKSSSSYPLVAGAAAQDWAAGQNYSANQKVIYNGITYITNSRFLNAPAAPTISGDFAAANTVRVAIDDLGAKSISATGSIIDRAENSVILVHDSNLGIGIKPVYRILLGTQSADSNTVISGATNVKILNAGFHVETYLGEPRTGTKAYDEFVTHNNSSDESRVRVVVDGTNIIVQQGTNVKITGGFIDFHADVSGYKTRPECGVPNVMLPRPLNP